MQGVVLDAALLFCRDGNGVLGVEPHAEKLLYRLSYSNLHLGILFRESNEHFTPDKETLARAMAPMHLLCIEKSNDAHLTSTLRELASSWAISNESCMFVSAFLAQPCKVELLNQGWFICLISGVTLLNASSRASTIKHLQELSFHIASINKVMCHELIIVGYTMKWSRERDFLKRGALPLHPTGENLCFFPVNLDWPLLQQLAIVDIMLQKPTDEIKSITCEESANLGDRIQFTDGMQQLTRFLHEHPHICVVDPIERILPLLDRALTQEILQGLTNLVVPNHLRIRSPCFVKVPSFDDPDLLEMLKASKVSLPAIVKSQMACGVPDAHKMAVVFKHEGYLSLTVPTPSTIQEYIDHGSRQYKFYVVGGKVMYSIRRSTPDAALLSGAAASLQIPAAITFDSLKSLPSSFVENAPNNTFSSSAEDDLGELDLETVHSAAMWLREKLQLTIFGFDVVVQSTTRDHVIIDVNFFPTFKDVDENKANSAFWVALLEASNLHKEAICIFSQ